MKLKNFKKVKGQEKKVYIPKNKKNEHKNNKDT